MSYSSLRTAAVWITFPQGAVFQGLAAPAGERGPSLHRSPMGSPAPPCIQPLQRRFLLHELWVDLCILMDLHGLQEHSCFTMVCSMSYRGISAPMAEARPLPLFPLIFVPAWLFSHVLTLLFFSHNYNYTPLFVLISY